MDETERSANEYLRYCGFKNPVYEPDGRVPPDFVIEGGIAVEVRRLNQMHNSGVETSGLEQIQRSFAVKVPFLLKDLGPLAAGKSWFVSLSFKRPLPPWRLLRKHLVEQLQAFSQDERRLTESHHTIGVERNLTIHLDRASSTHVGFFVFAGYSDLDAGGWVISELERNIATCIAEKTRTVAPFRHKYCEWWLVLIDRISYANIQSGDLVAWRNRLAGLADWDRVVLVSPIDTTHGLQIWPPQQQ